MRNTRIRFQAGKFRTGVSLHSHTLHSRESLDFIYTAAKHSALLRWVLRRGEKRYRAHHGSALDLRRGWWTPPLAPLDAYAVEAGQIQALGMSPIVSLTDHDDIEAPMSLQAVGSSRHIPVSVEWTVPYGRTFFHLGVHNFAVQGARQVMARLKDYTADPKPASLREIFADLDADPAALIVFNHPLWDERGIGENEHRKTALSFLREHGRYLHALELNGLRPWTENQAALALAREWGKPVLAGGDRHVLEPNACINLTNAADFAEFAQEVRRDEWSDVLVMPHYSLGHAKRIFRNMLDVFRTYENHGYGWKDWADRVFFTQDDGSVASLAQIWEGRPPAAVAVFAGFMKLAGSNRSLTVAGQPVAE
jgi:hypothetical protein